jgi:Cof subfamily protein (haloacid dehalogenase superfamily)
VEPLAAIRLVLSDLDETLLGPSHLVGKRSRAAIARLQQAGITFAVCTGRAPETTRGIVAELGLRYYVCNNGASLHDGARILAERVMPAAVTADLVDFFTMRHIPVYLMTPDGYFLSQRTPATDAANQARQVTPAPLVHSAIPAHKVMAWGGAAAYDECRAQFGDRVHIIYHADYLEIAPEGVSKQWGAERLAAHLGLKAAQVAAVGDARNDIEMVRWAGVGAAMGNADPLLTAVADRLLPGHEADGAALLFEAVLRGAW